MVLSENPKEIAWSCNSGNPIPPTIQEIMEAAQKEFPHIPLNKLAVRIQDHDDEVVISLKQSPSRNPS